MKAWVFPKTWLIGVGVWFEGHTDPAVDSHYAVAVRYDFAFH